MRNCVFSSGKKGTRCGICDKPLTRDYEEPPRRNCTASVGAPYITQLAPGHWLWQCRVCDWSLSVNDDEDVQHVCGQKEAPKLGDRIEMALKSVGITQSRWKAFKRRFGLPPTCNCPENIEWWNNVGDKLGSAARAAVEKIR